MSDVFAGCRCLVACPPECAPYGLPEDVIQAFVVGSAYIFDATREASVVARRDRRTIAFLFNCKLVVIRPSDDPDTIARRWWFDANGETPEQTWARR